MTAPVELAARYIYRVAQKKVRHKVSSISLSNIDRFLKFFHCCILDFFSNHFITNFPLSAPVKKNWQSVNIWQRYVQNFVAYFFLGHPVGL